MTGDEATDPRRNSPNKGADGVAPPGPGAAVNDTVTWTVRPPRRLRGAVVVRLLLMSLSGGSMLIALILWITGHASLAGRVFAGAVFACLMLILAL
jgi:hypothetical protein